VADISKKAQERRLQWKGDSNGKETPMERRLQWYRHVMRNEEDCVVRRVMDMEVEGRRRRGRPKRRWRDCLEGHFREKAISGDEYTERGEWRRLVKSSHPV